ncbi:potassium transporter Kup [Bosea sp. WAO]|uniref:potassium transporter Kup n=1 Tax=Bosea sp. WAO TaxID=406341 RepID=UPI0009FA3200|nr:potassium transporter Kup [Bosea sp. WAO]
MGHDQQNPAPAKPDGDRFGLEEPANGGHSSHSYAALALGALGVVFGDIGTSPLYALRETILAATGAASGGHGGAAEVTLAGPLPREVILGVLSLILWSLVSVVTLKYVVLLLRADNNGEGGTLTLVALAQRALGRSRGGVVLFLGMAGAALFYGDAVITPAISVLSAIEGIKLVTPVLDDYVVTIASVIMIALFLVQSRGTAKVANFFGPVMTVWFVTLGGLGIYHISDDLGVLASINPYHGLRFFIDHPGLSLAVLGTVCLAVTGAEALYADMGHFGRGPIRGAWLYLVFPALWLNYLGQGALILSDSSAIENPFFRLAPQGFTLPLVIMATIATIIASQAVITGAFSLTRQAIQLGLLPRLEIRHTSEHTSGQIFIPRMNTLLLLTVLLLIWTFRTSSNLSHAYGISVFGAMAVDSLLAFIVIWRGWRWSLLATSLVLVPFIIIDLAFFSANLLKLFSGGYVPVLFAIALTVLMWTWVRGTRILFDKTRKTDVPLLELVGMLTKSPPYRVKGMAVFLTSDPETAPASLLHNLKHNKVLHERNVILTVRSADTPRVAESERVRLSRITDDFWRVEMIYGYMESPNVPKGLAILRKQGFKFDIMSTSFFLSRRSIKASPNSGMPVWQDNLFIGLTKSATDATNFFQIPTGRVVEVGTQVTV